MYMANVTSDGNTGEEVIFKINITSLPTGGANYRVYKTNSTGGALVHKRQDQRGLLLLAQLLHQQEKFNFLMVP